MPQTQDNYYAQKLNSQKLYRIYDTALPRIRQYLSMETDFVRKQLHRTENVLEVGAGYGRILKELSPHAKSCTGIDISEDSVAFGREYLKECPNVRLEVMDAHKLEFTEEFDVTLCLQNGLSAMKGDPMQLIGECMKTLVKGGKAYFSTYSGRFWAHRLAWFEEQADKGLLGEIDREQTKNGVIVCKDGFRAMTFTEEDFQRLGKASGCPCEIREIDESSLFLILTRV